MLELGDALARVLEAVPSPGAERVPLNQAHRRVLLESVVSSIDLPPFDQSAMDGYAVRSADVASAAKQTPVRLRIIGRVPAGEVFEGEAVSGTCVRLFTGSMLPAGTDAVVMQEDTRLAEGSVDEVFILDAAKPWENVRLRGEDIKRGAGLAQPGEMLTATRLSLLAGGGISEVNVGRVPVVGLLATGSELKEPGQALERGQIYESNRSGLGALIRGVGGVPRCFPVVPDALAATRLALIEAFQQCDLLVTSGGVSVGELDYIREAFERAGGKLQFWRVAMKPGRPFVFGRWRDKLLFGLPGNPVSAFVTFLMLVRPALLRFQGAAEVSLPSAPGELAEPLSNPGQQRHLARVFFDSSGKVKLAGAQGSHLLSTLAAANGLVDLPAQTSFPAGTIVPVLRWEET